MRPSASNRQVEALRNGIPKPYFPTSERPEHFPKIPHTTISASNRAMRLGSLLLRSATFARLMPELQLLAPHPLPASVQCLNNLLRQRTLVQGCQILLKVLRATRANNDGIALLSLHL